MRTRRQYLVETLSHGQFAIHADTQARLVHVERTGGHALTLASLTIDEAQELMAALDAAVTELGPLPPRP